MSVKLPVLLDSSMQESAVLYPAKGSLKIKASGVSEAQLTLADKSPSIPMHGWVKIWNQNGFVGVFRRTSRNNNITVDKSVTLRHGIDILNDSVWDAQEDFEGTLPEYITAILNHQTSLINGVRPWVLGTCEKTASVSKSINYDNLMDLLHGTVDDGEDYYFTYDQAVWPWQINLVSKPAGVLSEFRLNRNIERCKISDNDSELCTRLLLNINKTVESTDPDTQTETKTVWRVYNNAAGQAAYGIITKTADIDVTQDTLPNGPFPEADAWAAAFFAKRAAPQLQIQIDGLVLKQITGLDWDESRICELCRVALPDYTAAIEQRVVAITYPDLYKDEIPQRISVSLANVLPSYTNSLNDLARQTTVLASENRYTERIESSFSKRFAIYDKQGNILRQAGMELDANGFLVYADDRENMVGARFNLQADMVGMVVGTNPDGNHFIKAGEIALSINSTTGESTALIDASHVNISATNTAHLLVNALEADDNGNLIVTASGGMKVRKTDSGGIVAEYGVFDQENLTAGVIVDKVNGGSVYLKGSKIWVGDAASDQTLKKWATESDGLFAQNIGALSARIGTIEADYIRTQNLSSEIANISSLSVQNVNFASMTSSRGGVSAYSGAFTNFSLAGVSMTTSDVVKSVVGSTITGGGYKFTVTMLNGSSQDYSFNTASSLTFSGAWAGASYTATAKDVDDNVLGSVTTSISKRWNGSDLLVESGNDTLLTESMSAHVGTGNLTTGGLRTIDTFNSSHKAYGYVIGNSMSYPLFTFNVDATSEYNAGSTEGYTSGHTAGYAEGRTDYRPGSITQDTANKQITVLNDAGDSLATYSVLTTYNAGVTAGEGHFSKAALTLQGSAVTITPVGTPYRFSNLTRYKGNGGTVYARGNTQPAFVTDSSGGYYLRGTSHRYNYHGTLYYFSSTGQAISAGNGYWHNTGRETIYYGDGTRLGSTTLYKGDGGTYYDRGDSESVLVPDTSGSIYRYAAGAAITRYTAGTSYTTANSPYYTKTT